MTFRGPPRAFRITLLFGAFLDLCAEANYLLRYLLAGASSHIAIKMERVQEDLLPSENGWWRDFRLVGSSSASYPTVSPPPSSPYLLCGIGLLVFRGRRLTPLAVAAIATAFPLLFLLREANILLALALVPLVWAALPRTHRLGRLTGVYAPLALVFIMMALWQQYRTGYFLVTTGGQGNPVEALALIDKISPILDQENPVDRAVRSVTAGMAPSDVAQNSWSIAVKINELLAEQLDIRAPQIARLALNRYLSVWLEHPFEMLAHVARNQTIIRTAGVSPVVYNDRHLSARTREFHSFASQRVVEWGLINLPLLWFVVLVVAAPLRRTALLTFGLWVTSMVPVLFYSAMFLETRYVLSSLGPILLVLALTIGTGIRVLSRKAAAAMRHCGTPSSASPPSYSAAEKAALFAGLATKFHGLQ